ncbi:MAG TPA: phosphotransferase [Anaerolineae bacterium]|nr:phosphotransferase [Anaerolineae bacterium]
MKDFYELTNRGRALRLRKMALQALERYDLELRRVRLLTNDMNGIFRVDTADGQKCIVRVTMPEGGHALEEIRSEMMWLVALRRDTDPGVPEPIATHNGALVTTVEAAGVPEARHCAVFSWVPGPDLADRLTLENVSKMGELSARLHAHAETFDPPEGFWIKRSDSIFPFGEPVVLFDEPFRDLFPAGRRHLFQDAMEQVETTIDRLFADRWGLRVLHNDLHQWNVKVYRGKLYALDFEDLMWGYPVQDIAITLYYWQGHDRYESLREAFQRGYTRHSDWPEQVPGQIDTLMAGRALNLANFILLDPNPEWRREAPTFIERTEGRLRAWMERS